MSFKRVFENYLFAFAVPNFGGLCTLCLCSYLIDWCHPFETVYLMKFSKRFSIFSNIDFFIVGMFLREFVKISINCGDIAILITRHPNRPLLTDDARYIIQNFKRALVIRSSRNLKLTKILALVTVSNSSAF